MQIDSFLVEEGVFFVLIHGKNSRILFHELIPATTCIDAVRKALDILESRNGE